MRALMRRAHDREEGAIAMIVAVSLVFLVGMLVLVFDLGRSVAAQRDMENATAAAALAAAQECALGNGSTSAQGASDDLLLANTANWGTATTPPIVAPQCNAVTTGGPKTVSVSSSVEVDYFFAQIFGLTSGTVGYTAMAEWGPITKANPVPITVNYQALVGCEIPTVKPPAGETRACELTYPKDQFSNPAWGILNLAEWNRVTPETDCHVSNADIVSIIEAGGWPGDQVPLNEPPFNPDSGQGVPTYDCLDNGLQFDSWATLQGRVLTFPVVDIPTSITDASSQTQFQDCVPVHPHTCDITNADVIGFIPLKVDHVENCADELGAAAVCVTVEWSPTINEGVPGQSDLDFGDDAVVLIR